MGDAATTQLDSTGPDPRPKSVERNGDFFLRGWRCAGCGLARAAQAPRCPDCGGHLAETEFAAEGTVWSSTIVHLDIQGHSQPYGLTYVDLVDGPRFLAHAASAESPIPVGTRVKIIGTTARGDVQVAPLDHEFAK